MSWDEQFIFPAVTWSEHKNRSCTAPEFLHFACCQSHAMSMYLSWIWFLFLPGTNASKERTRARNGGEGWLVIGQVHFGLATSLARRMACVCGFDYCNNPEKVVLLSQVPLCDGKRTQEHNNKRADSSVFGARTVPYCAVHRSDAISSFYFIRCSCTKGIDQI